MITATISVEPVDKGWVLRVGSDVLVRYPTKAQALLNAQWRAKAIRQSGGRAVVVEEPPGAAETGSKITGVEGAA